MDLLFVIDPPESLKAYKDTSVAMMRAAQKRGHAVWVCEQESLHWKQGRVSAAAQRISLTDNDEDWYRPHETAARPLTDFGATLMRKDPPFDLEYVTSTWLLSAAEREGARVFNAPRRGARPQREVRDRRISPGSRCPPSSRAAWSDLQALRR